MRGLRSHWLRRLGALFVIALTLAPVALSGHQHSSTEGSAPNTCAVCVVAHHTPATNLTLQPHLAPHLHAIAWSVSDELTPVHIFRPIRAGRAPPFSNFRHLA